MKRGKILLLLFLPVIILFAFLYYEGLFESKKELPLLQSLPLETSPKTLNSEKIFDVKDAFKFLINKSKKSIYIAGLYFTSNINWQIKRDLKRAIKRGVKIKFLLNDTGFSREEMKRLNFYKYTNVEVRFINISKLGSNEWGDFHNKYAIFDEKYAILGSANFSYPAFNNNIEINALIIDEKVVKQLTKIFLTDFNYAKNKIPPNFNFNRKKFQLNFLEEPIFITETAPAPLNSPDILDNDEAVKYLLNSAKSEILLQIYALTSSQTNFPILHNTLIKKYKEGVSIKILIDSNLYTKNSNVKYTIDNLCKEGIEIKRIDVSKASDEEFSAMHSKMLIIDKKFVMLGSCNWSKSGMSENRELSIVTSYTQIVNPLYKKFYSDYNSLFSYNLICDR